MVDEPKIPAFPEVEDVPKIFVAVVVVIYWVQFPFNKTNPFPHLTHLKSGVKATQLAGMLPTNPNKFSKYMTPVLPISKIAMLELREAPDVAALFEL